jgi:uracil-DNA glycosylase
MRPEPTTLLSDARRWVEQERVWDDVFYTAETRDARQQSAGMTALDIRSGPVSPSVIPAAAGGNLSTSVDKTSALQALYDRYKECTRCPLGATRIKVVFGVGNPNAQVVFIGEGPGYEEDRRGEPFVGKAGQLLDKIMAAIGLNRQNAYIANIVKCHPMQNPETPEARGNDRAPNSLEVETCSPILKEQLAIIQPRFIVTLGSPSTRTLLQTSDGITKLRGRLVPFAADSFFAAPQSVTLDETTRQALSRTQVLPTYHPAALLRNEDLKKDVWTDMKLLRTALQQALF